MRRIIKNSTAIIACLSLLTPHLAWAQEQDEPRRQRPAASEEVRPEITSKKPEGNARQQQRNAKEGAAKRQKGPGNENAAKKRRNAENKNKKNGQKQLELRRDKQAEPKAKPVKQQKKQAERQKKQAERKEKQAQSQRNRQNAKDHDRVKERLGQKAESGDAKEKKPQRVKNDQAKEKKRNKEDRPRQAKNGKDKDGSGKFKNKPWARADGKSSPNKPHREKPKQAENSNKADRKQRDRETARDVRLFTRNKDGRIRLSESEVAQKRQNNMGGLNRVLREEVQSGLDESRLTCLSGAAYPCNDGSAAITPGGVVLERQKNGRFVMAPAARQMYRVNDNGKVVRRVAEEGSAQTAIAREFARAAGIPNAAALIDGGRRGRIYEQRVTRENSRSSREDFATSLRDGWSGSNNWRDRRSDDDDDDNDLTKALVLGLGALAVGSMLNNNRQVALSTPDRVVVTRPDGSQEVIKDEVALLREPGSTVTTENFDDGSSRTIVTRADGSKIVTIRDADLRVLRRSLISPDGQSTPLIDDTMEVAPVDIAELPAPVSPSPYQDGQLNEEELREALRREADIDRRFSLAQIRNIPEVRSLVAPVDIEGVTFDTGSAAIRPEQADRLAGLGNVIHETIQENPNEIFLIEGHTDTVGASATNLALSDRRAESVALALSEYYDVPPENLVVQGYGEQYPKVRSNGDIRENRRASVRRITDLLQGAE